MGAPHSSRPSPHDAGERSPGPPDPWQPHRPPFRCHAGGRRDHEYVGATIGVDTRTHRGGVANPQRELPDNAFPAVHAAGSPILFDKHHILAFAAGKPSDAFGEPYRIFDEG